ncbi:MAG: UTP--glucose-1-phosphate uridylyltransferase GalU [Rhodanobacteraceae bacterium]
MQHRLRKVVFPVAGLGTRFLPASKVVAKEMLPVLDQPLIQYAVDEAVNAGAETLVFVTNRYKHSIADYFDKAYELESKLDATGKHDLLGRITDLIPANVQCVFVTQAEALGLGHAVLCAKAVIGDETFGVILPDDLIWNGPPGNGRAGALRQMAELGAAEGASVIAVEEVPHEDTAKYGIVDIKSASGRTAQVRHLVEKPQPADAPSNLGIVGRYVLSSRIFDKLERTRPGAGGEIQLTDAIEALLDEQPVLACRFEGTRFDCGNKLGVLRATIALALADAELAPAVREFLKGDAGN